MIPNLVANVSYLIIPLVAGYNVNTTVFHSDKEGESICAQSCNMELTLPSQITLAAKIASGQVLDAEMARLS